MKSVFKVGSIIMIAILMVMFIMPSVVEAKTPVKKICIGWTVQLSVDTKKSITWTSSDTGVATVSKKGLVTGKGVGSVFIFAKYGNNTKSWLFSVSPAEEEVVYHKDISKPVGLVVSKKSLFIGRSYTLKLNGVAGKAKWESSNKSIVTVSSKGNITAKKKGTATVTVTVNKKKYTCKITVMDEFLFSDVSEIKTTVGKKTKIIITFNTIIDDTIYVKVNNDAGNNESRDILTYEFGEFDGDDVPLYVTALSKGTANLIIATENSSEKVIVPITIN